ncbi:ABC transporter ATP-binding protein [Bacillus sp. Marseille-Q3570]|uniref:ABC transporter ATP-binding protein n=1 Tax=Bacillus sp. Marseille-Q3570 TaxID=2963522 RepID=UPI0021B7552D|nr:ABC transporter ATP-binding protein [Bacillus sp. Marseille-Q3570]
MKNKPILKLQNIHKSIGKNQILSDVELEVNHGEIMGLLGPNGSGKTTMIRIIVGLMKADKGQILIHGHDLNKEFTQAIKHIGAIVENPEFYEHLSGLQNLQQYAAMDPTITENRLKEVVGIVNLGKAIYDKVSTYSLGMRQRLGIAQAILHQPKLLILDEPTNGLDPLGMREFREYIRALSKTENVSIIIASHLLREIEDLCDRVAIIQSGRILKVRHLNDKEQQSTSMIRFKVDAAERTKHILRNMNVEAEADGLGIDVMVSKQDIPHVVENLVNEGIKIYSITAKHQTLEEAFFEATEEPSNDV